jgi:ferric-chelate reductase (NADPH)
VVTDEGIDWGDGVRPQARDYTPLYDEARHELVSISSFMMAALPATGRLRRKWRQTDHRRPARFAGGAEDYAWQLYVCDESGMPALRRRLEALQNCRFARKFMRL